MCIPETWCISQYRSDQYCVPICFERKCFSSPYSTARLDGPQLRIDHGGHVQEQRFTVFTPRTNRGRQRGGIIHNKKITRFCEFWYVIEMRVLVSPGRAIGYEHPHCIPCDTTPFRRRVSF